MRRICFVVALALHLDPGRDVVEPPHVVRGHDEVRRPEVLLEALEPGASPPCVTATRPRPVLTWQCLAVRGTAVPVPGVAADAAELLSAASQGLSVGITVAFLGNRRA